MKLIPWNVNKICACLNKGFVDIFRCFYTDKEDIYTWWSYITGTRDSNLGWTIDCPGYCPVGLVV